VLFAGGELFVAGVPSPALATSAPELFLLLVFHVA
jgi:hypothetical protein